MTANATSIPILPSVSALAESYDTWLCDIWGVMHNGQKPFPDATVACETFREKGGRVILISNSPRPHGAVTIQLDEIGVPAAAYDAIVTSGDTTRHELQARANRPLFHLGPERDKPLLAGLELKLAELSDAEFVLCSGLYDDLTETPDDYAELLGQMKSRDMLMVCANPDIQVERGDRLIYCAGALAQAYENIGGRVLYTGKPHPPIYKAVFEKLAELTGTDTPHERILCIGDGLKTDMAGAFAAGLDALFIASALHVAGGAAAGLDERTLADLFAESAVKPVAAQTRLLW